MVYPCIRCGAPHGPGDQFCTTCGAKLTTQSCGTQPTGPVTPPPSLSKPFRRVLTIALLTAIILSLLSAILYFAGFIPEYIHTTQSEGGKPLLDAKEIYLTSRADLQSLADTCSAFSNDPAFGQDALRYYSSLLSSTVIFGVAFLALTVLFVTSLIFLRSRPATSAQLRRITAWISLAVGLLACCIGPVWIRLEYTTALSGTYQASMLPHLSALMLLPIALILALFPSEKTVSIPGTFHKRLAVICLSTVLLLCLTGALECLFSDNAIHVYHFYDSVGITQTGNQYIRLIPKGTYWEDMELSTGTSVIQSSLTGQGQSYTQGIDSTPYLMCILYILAAVLTLPALYYGTGHKGLSKPAARGLTAGCLALCVLHMVIVPLSVLLADYSLGTDPEYIFINNLLPCLSVFLLLPITPLLPSLASRAQNQ